MKPENVTFYTQFSPLSESHILIQSVLNSRMDATDIPEVIKPCDKVICISKGP
jgi:hypothetical protein